MEVKKNRELIVGNSQPIFSNQNLFMFVSHYGERNSITSHFNQSLSLSLTFNGVLGFEQFLHDTPGGTCVPPMFVR